MPKVSGHPPGTFCWFELATTDQGAAKSFYASLFGWTAADFPMGPSQYYTMFRLNGDDAAAAYTIPREQRPEDTPHWNLYVAVDSADDTVKRASELGGKLLAPPFDVMTAGRMAVIQDPTGAVFNIWQGRDNKGTTVAGESGTFCWADLSTGDPSAAKQFYEGLFGWKIGVVEKYPPDYLVIKNGEQSIAGITPVAYRNPKVPPHWMLFFLAGDVDGAAAKAKELGATQIVPPVSVGTARMSVLADPQGAVFSMIQPQG